MSPELIVTEAFPLDQPIRKGDASQMDTMSHTPLTVLQPPDCDCVAVYSEIMGAWSWMDLMEFTSYDNQDKKQELVWFRYHVHVNVNLHPSVPPFTNMV